MAGGIGSRFWPASRANYPKQFLDIMGTGKSLIQETFDRFSKFCLKENIFIITNKSYADTVLEQIPDITKQQILIEPLRRNTAPCVCYFSHKIKAINPNAITVIAPSDHIVQNQGVFEETILNAVEFAQKSNALVTLGVQPSRPDTGYGYIQHTTESAEEGVFKVKTFTEKPDRKLAETFIQSGDFLWNSGIFIWSANTIVQEFEKHQSEINEIFAEGVDAYNTPDEPSFINSAYSMCTNISIDYGIMEKAEDVFVIPADLGWSDLGTWTSLYEQYEKDYVGNAVSGDNVMVYDTSNSMIMVPNGKLVVLQGLEDYFVVDTDDVLMICKKDNEGIIKQITADIKQQQGDDFL